MKFTKEFIDRARNIIHNQIIPPEYNPVEWTDKKFNCYMYALQLSISIDNRELPIGFTTGESIERDDYTSEVVLERFLCDCKNLKLNCSKIQIDDKVSKEEYKIALYVWEKWSYHLKREDCDGNWSEKRGWHNPISRVKREDVLKDDLFKLIGIFKISKKKE